MKTKYIILVTLSVLVVLLSFIIYLSDLSFLMKKDTIYIAMAAPMSGKSKIQGKHMYEGVQLYLDDYNKTNKKYNIKLIVFNDKNDKRRAIKIASKIVTNNDVLMVIGHYSSNTSIPAGDVYKKIGMPVITASATANIVTTNNNWYFRSIVENDFIGSLIAYYIKQRLNINSASIIFDTDNYGRSLLKAFEKTASSLDLKINNKWALDTSNKKIDRNLKKIINKIRAIENPGAVFLALNGEEAGKVIVLLKFPGTNYTIIGADSLCSELCLQYLKNNPMEKKFPGYHSDNIYGISHFVSDLSDKKALIFKKKYMDKYLHEPSWVSATYYDAIHIVTEAIERAEIHDVKNFRERRKLVRNALVRINSPESSVEGVCGRTFFNSNGDDINKAPPMCIFQNLNLIPLYYQYNILSDINDNHSKSDLIINEDTIKIGKTLMNPYNVIYTGIDIIQVKNPDIKTSSCTIDFFIWFRFAGNFDDKNIVFTNAIKPVRLNKPVMETCQNDITVRAYRVKAEFKIDYIFYKYPLDQLNINIRLRHKTIPKSKLLYFPDYSGMPDLNKLKSIFGQATENSMNIIDVQYYQNKIQQKYYSTNTLNSSKQVVEYSQFNAVYKLQRRSFIMMFKNFLPIISAVIFLYIGFFLPSTYYKTQLVLNLAATLTCGLYHTFLNLIFKVNYILYIDYVFFGAYVLFAISFLFFYKTSQLLKAKAYNKIKRIRFYMLIFYPLWIITIGLSLGYLIIN